MMKKIMQAALLGALIGLSTSYIILSIILVQNPTVMIDGKELFLEFRLAILLGMGCGMISLILQLERWSIALKLAVHYVVILTLVLVCGAIGDWYDNPIEQPGAFMLFLGIQFVVYVAIFAIMYWMDAQEVKRINDKLNKKEGGTNHATTKL